MDPIQLHTAFLEGIGTMEWLIIMVVALLLFGSRLPTIMRGLGSSVKEFKKGMDEGTPEHPPAAYVPPPGYQLMPTNTPQAPMPTPPPGYTYVPQAQPTQPVAQSNPHAAPPATPPAA